MSKEEAAISQGTPSVCAIGKLAVIFITCLGTNPSVEALETEASTLPLSEQLQADGPFIRKGVRVGYFACPSQDAFDEYTAALNIGNSPVISRLEHNSTCAYTRGDLPFELRYFDDLGIPVIDLEGIKKRVTVWISSKAISFW